MKNSSLRVRLTLAALLPLFLGLAAAWVIATLTFDRTLKQRVSDQLTDTADVLTRSGLPYTPELLQRIADLQRTSIVVLDASGAVLLSTSGDLSSAVRRRIENGALREPPADTPTAVELAGQSAMLTARTLPHGADRRASRVVVAASLQDAREAARRAAVGMGLAALAAAALLLTIQYFLVRGITRPIDELVEMAHGIAAGQRDVQASTVRNDEIAALGYALNVMTAKLRDYEAELAERSRFAALGEMSARIAHEIRNPLTGLKLNLQLLAERTAGADRDRVQRLLDEVARLELIVTSSLSLTGPRSAQKLPGDLNGAVGEVLQLMEPSLRHRRIALESERTPLPEVAFDRDRIKQAVLNLLVNAADALPEGGRILVRTGVDRQHNSARVTVEDSGPGIAPELRDRLHEISGSRKPFGLGLGLRVCREIADEHGGRLHIGDSAGLGGASMTLELPLQASA